MLDFGVDCNLIVGIDVDSDSDVHFDLGFDDDVAFECVVCSLSLLLMLMWT